MKPFATHGAFGWIELQTTDPQEAAEYYSSVLGWTIQEHEFPQGIYRTATIDGKVFAGIMTCVTDETPPHWGLYVTVDDVDDVIELARTRGAKILMEPEDMESVGRMATFADPQGAVISVVSYENPEADHQVEVETRFTAHGAPSWFELRVPEAESAAEFYREVIGWTIEFDDMHMGPYGIIKTGDLEIGGMFSVDPEEMPPHWGLYATVGDLNESLDDARRAGGTPMHDPVDVPDVGKLCMVEDPHGAVLAHMEYDSMHEEE